MHSLKSGGNKSYPSGCNRTCSISALLKKIPGEENRHIIAGRIICIENRRNNDKQVVLEDESGAITIVISSKDSEDQPVLRSGDIVEITVKWSEKQYHALHIRILTSPQISNPPAQLISQMKRRKILEIRVKIFELIRDYFRNQGFLEIETPYLYPASAIDPYIEPIPVDLDQGQKTVHRYFLPTSPEFPMKRLLVNGYEKIFFLGKVFRNEIVGRHNLPEFTMLEWYRAYQDYTKIMNDTRELIVTIIDSMDMDINQFPYGNTRLDLSDPWKISRISDLFQSQYGIDIDTLTNSEKLSKFAQTLFSEINQNWSYSDIFFKLFLERIEPGLGFPKPEFVTDFPVQLGALARKRDDDSRFVERFELYIAGLELGNAYTELNDPHEQEQRFTEILAERRILSKPPLPMDQLLLSGMKYGMPPAGGIALGVDRLVMLITNCQNIKDVVWFN